MSGRVLVCGSRTWSDAESVNRELDALRPLCVIEGNAPGADHIAGRWAVRHLVALDAYPADWSRGRRAGPERNARMLAKGKPDRGLAFGPLWIAAVCGVCGDDYRGRAECRKCDGTGRSGWKNTGTGGMVALMLAARLPVRWIAAPGAAPVDLVTMPGPPR